MTDNTVIIFTLDGTPERHTRPNARDLVNAGKAFWNKSLTSTPAAYAPFAAAKMPTGSVTQEVLNKATGGNAEGKASAVANSEALIQAQLAAQQAAMAAEAEAARQAEAALSDIPDFSAPPAHDVAAEEAAEAALEAEVEAEAEAQIAAAAPTTRRRRNS